MTATFIVLAILLAIFVVANVWARVKIKRTPLPPDHPRVLQLNDANFKSQLKNKLVLVDFWAEWCAPCRLMAPILNELAAELEGNCYVGKVNIERYPALAQQYRIRSIPTLILYKNGVEVQRIVGVKTKEYLHKQIAQNK
ncbi:MAG TPA: thioredoxin [Bacteroidales bacterium]|nr:thioredoxin [Bacteroidales bacterium]